MAEQSRVYGNFRGVDFTSDPAQVSPYRFSHCVNMWKDYESQNGIAVETFPGYRRLATAVGDMNGIHKFGNKIYCHIGTEFYLLDGVQFKEKASGLADHKSTSFVWGDKLYILDGETYWVYDEAIEDNPLKKVSDDAYVPTVEVNGTEVEQRNILSSKQIKSFLFAGFDSTYSPFLTFNTVPFQSGIVQAFSFTGLEYKGSPDVDHVLKIPEKIGENIVEGIAFEHKGTLNLIDLIIPSTVKHIAAGSFANIPINRVWFGGTATQWSEIISNYPSVEAELGNVPIFFGQSPDSGVLYYDGNLSSKNLTDTLSRYNASLVYVEEEDGYTKSGTYILVRSGIEGIKKLSADITEDVEIDESFTKCTIVQSFNGNLFFSGSPAAPSKIWWCAAPKDTGIPNPTYIGEYNFDLCGLDDSPIVSMMAQSSVLTVFKQKSDQDATIYYYSALQSESDLVPSIYAESEGGSGIACIGSSCNFLDDAVFLSKRGLEGIQKTAVNLERSVVHRSSFVDAKLQTEDLSNAWLLEWKGYLCVLFPNGHMYLADSRRTASGNEGTEYEWFYVEGLRGYETDSTIYAYADEGDYNEYVALTGVGIKPDYIKVNNDATIDDVAFGTIISFPSYVGGKTYDHYYEEETSYLCRPTDEYADENDEDITCAAVIDDVLYFGAGGALYCINTDKREGDTIPNEYYTFCGRRYKSGFVTFADNCGVPHLRKKIIKKSLVVKTKSMDNSKFYLKVGTDRVPFNENEEVHTSGTLDFGALKFDTMDLFDQDKTIVPFRASAKKFVEAQLMLYSDGFKRPFGVYNMAFRFEVTGRVKE